MPKEWGRIRDLMLSLSLAILASPGHAATEPSTRNACETRVLNTLADHPLKYVAKSNGITAKGQRLLSKPTKGSASPIWQLSSNSQWMFISIQETSQFTWPSFELQHYEMRRKGLSKSKNYRMDRQTNGDISVQKHKAAPQRLPSQAPLFDPLNHQLKLQLDLACLAPSDVYEYRLAKHSGVKTYRFRRIGQETITTAAGTFDSIVLEKEESNRQRNTRVWFANTAERTLLKLSHQEKDRETLLELTQKPAYWP